MGNGSNMSWSCVKNNTTIHHIFSTLTLCTDMICQSMLLNKECAAPSPIHKMLNRKYIVSTQTFYVLPTNEELVISRGTVPLVTAYLLRMKCSFIALTTWSGPILSQAASFRELTSSGLRCLTSLASASTRCLTVDRYFSSTSHILSGWDRSTTITITVLLYTVKAQSLSVTYLVC